jgi:hypothetical protein
MNKSEYIALKARIAYPSLTSVYITKKKVKK